jgi:hypothetical protein
LTEDDQPAAFDATALITTLRSHNVTYLVVGGLSARAYGSQRLTYDLDCVPARTAENLRALADALRELNARLRIDRVSDEESRALPVDIEHLLRVQEVSLWQTDAGPVDVLHGLRDRDGHLHDYEDLQARAVTRAIGDERVQVAALEDLLASKEWAGRPKDRDVVDELRSLACRASFPAPTAPSAAPDQPPPESQPPARRPSRDRSNGPER